MTPTGWRGSTTPSWSTSRRHDPAPAAPLRRRRPARDTAGGRVGGLAAPGPVGPDAVLAHPGLDGHRGRGRDRRGRDGRIGGPARLRPGQRHRGHGVHHRDLAVHRHPAGQRHPERRAQQLVAVSFFLLAPYIAAEAIRALAAGDRAETSIIGLVLTAGTAVFEPALGVAKRRIGARLGSSATAGEGTQNLLCAYLAIAVFAGLAANTLSAPGGSTAWSRWASRAGQWSKDAGRGPGNRAAAHVSQLSGSC